MEYCNSGTKSLLNGSRNRYVSSKLMCEGRRPSQSIDKRKCRYEADVLSVLSLISSLRRDHTLSSDLPLMRLFFISPQQKISSLDTGNETDSEFEVFSKRMTF